VPRHQRVEDLLLALRPQPVVFEQGGEARARQLGDLARARARARARVRVRVRRVRVKVRRQHGHRAARGEKAEAAQRLGARRRL